MAFNGFGTFTRLYNWVTDKGNSVKITASRMDNEMDGFATGLSNCITKDGQTTLSADIPFGSRKITGLGDATSDTDAMNRQTGDGRYIRNADALTIATSLENTDLLPLYDNTTGDNAAITWANVKTAVEASLGLGALATLDEVSGDQVGTLTRDLHIEKGWPGIELKPTAPGGTGRIDFIQYDRPYQDYQFRLRTNASSERIVFEHYDANNVYSHIYSLEGYGDIWTKSYGWLHHRFADQNGQQVAKAWASIDGTGTVVANAIYGFSQIQDMGSGKYRCTFSTARPNGNSCTQVSSTDRNGTGKGGAYIRAQTSTYVEVGIVRTGIGHMDEDIINVVVFGD